MPDSATSVTGSSASDRAALLTTVGWSVAAAGLLAVPALPMGLRILAAVVLWHVVVVTVGTVRRDDAWASAYTLVAPMSLLLVLPDDFLAVGLGTIAFPDTGAPFLDRIPLFMAGMWAIPLSAIVFSGRAAERRAGPVWGVVAGTVVGLAIFSASEALSGALPIWEPVGVPMWGPLAAYVLPAEAILSATTVLADRWARGRPVWQRVLAGAFVVQAYVGGLAVGWLLLGR